MCNLATISTGRKGHQVSGGLSLIFHSASPNDNSKSIRFPVVFFLIMRARGPENVQMITSKQSTLKLRESKSGLRLPRASYPIPCIGNKLKLLLS